MKLDARTAFLASDLLRTMAATDLDAVLARATSKSVETGHVILHRGNPASGPIVILQGRLHISVVSEDGGEATLHVLGPGQEVGEISLLDGRPASADVQAIEPCQLLLVHRANVLAILRRDAELCLRLMAVLCQRLRQANDTVEDLALYNLPDRIGRVLLRLAREFGRTEGSGVAIGIKLSQREIASLVGASREKVNRELRLLEEAGVISKRIGGIVILKPAELGGK